MSVPPRTDVLCKNPICGHVAGNHVGANTPLKGCRDCMKKQPANICDWVYSEKEGTTPPHTVKDLAEFT